jgi:Flp pilus assembly protein TadB
MKLSKHFIINSSIFLAAVVFLLLSPFLVVFNVLALLLFGVAFLILAINQTKVYQTLKKQVEVNRQELILELATEDGGEAYVYNKDKTLKRQNKKVNQFFKDRKVTLLFLYLIGAAFIYFSLRLVINLL